jgi:hypothetical protein
MFSRILFYQIRKDFIQNIYNFEIILMDLFISASQYYFKTAVK